MLDLDEALDSELVRAREMVVEVEQPELGPVRLLGLPVKFSRTPADRHAPGAGARASTPRRCSPRPASPPDEIAALLDSGAVAGLNVQAEQEPFLS